MQSGAPAHGSGGGTFSRKLPPKSRSDNPITSGRLSTSLSPEVRHAGAEIYVAMLGQGSKSVREWGEVNFGRMDRNSSMWLELWDRATQLDFSTSGFTSDAELMNSLASSDLCEIHLRRLAAYKYQVRTAERFGFQFMPAVKAPGASSDIAPSWLVSEATTHSKCEHQRG